MQPVLKQPRGLVVAAVGFDSRSDAVLGTATSLARRFDLDLHLVHAVEPTLVQPWGMIGASEIPYFPVYPRLDEEAREDAAKRLTELARRLETPFRPTTATPYGLAPQAIVAEALAKRANLIVAGYDLAAYNVATRGLSTAAGLLASAPLPVLAVNTSAALDFAKPAFKLLVADDLGEGTAEAVRRAYELAAELPGSYLKQVHVHGDFRELFRTRWQDLLAQMPTGPGRPASADALWETEHQAMLAKLRKQGLPFRRKAEDAGVVIDQEARAARSVSDEFHTLVEELSPDLVVFGRHRTLKTRPFLLGRMPLRTMLKLGKPVLVVPPADELYAKLPFPAAAT